MAVISDGGQKFGITTTLVRTSTETANTFVVESFTKNFTSNRVDLDNGAGEPLGSVTVGGRTEVSMTAQFGTPTTTATTARTTPTIGDEITYGSDTIIITDVTENEAQADFVRLDLSGYIKLN
jgi:hypothetical protein